MYHITDEFKEMAKKYRVSYYSNKLGITAAHLSNALNGNINCSNIIARGVLSLYFDILLSDNRIEELLEKYFTKTKEE